MSFFFSFYIFLFDENILGNTNCLKCNQVSVGTVWSSSTSCRPCNAGTQPKAPNYDVCEDCTLGKYTTDGKPCELCSSGSEPNLASKGKKT